MAYGRAEVDEKHSAQLHAMQHLYEQAYLDYEKYMGEENR